VAGKISWYQQLDCQSLAMEFSDGKLKQKSFFHSAREKQENTVCSRNDQLANIA
jgi:hypothetical protein